MTYALLITTAILAVIGWIIAIASLRLLRQSEDDARTTLKALHEARIRLHLAPEICVQPEYQGKEGSERYKEWAGLQ